MIRRLLTLATALIVGACATAIPTPSTTSPSARVSPAGPPRSPFAVATLDPAFSPSPTGCQPMVGGAGDWPSDRLVGVDVVDEGWQDTVRFRFGEPSRSGASSTVTVGVIRDEVTRDASGKPVEVRQPSAELRAEGLVSDAQGRPIFEGALDRVAGLTTVLRVFAAEAPPQAMRWVIEANHACVTLSADPASRTITLGFSHAVP